MQQSGQSEINGHPTTQVFLGFGDLYVSAGDHVADFYETSDESKSLLGSYYKAGLEAGEKCVYFAGSERGKRQLEEALTGSGVDLGSVLESGQMVIDVGRNQPEEFDEFLHSALAGIPGKFRLLRCSGDMSLDRFPAYERFAPWCGHINTVGEVPAIFFCLYDIKRFPGSVVMDALKTHPLCIVSSVVHQNPYYEEP